MRDMFWVVVLTLTTACAATRQEIYRSTDSSLISLLGTGMSHQGGAQKAIVARVPKPLDESAVVAMALMQNPRVRAELTSVEAAAGLVTQATTPRVTDVELLYRRGLSNSDKSELEVAVVQDVIDLFTTGIKRTTANLDFHAAQARATAAILQIAALTTARFYNVVANQQLLAVQTVVAELAEASFDLADRQHKAGNISNLIWLREKDYREQAIIAVKRAQADVLVSRAHLATAIGEADGKSEWQTIDALPALPAQEPPGEASADAALLAANLELQALGYDQHASERRSTMTSVRSWIPELAMGISAARRDNEEWDLGPALRVGVPLLNWSQGARAIAEAQVRRISLLSEAHTLALRNNFHAAVAAQRAAYVRVHRLQDIVVPLRQALLDETLLQYNAMNATTFDLILAKRAHIEAVREAIEALRDYWKVTNALTMMKRGASFDTPDTDALLGGSP